MSARHRLRLSLVLAALAGAVALSGCGNSADAHNEIPGGNLTVYVSVPLHGPSTTSGESVLHGAQLALDELHGRIGTYRVAMRALDDANPKTASWDPGLTEANVHAAMLDKSLIGYIGDFNSGASAISIPILNRDLIPQISPGSTAVGLTSGGPEASPGEPAKYYPTGRRTFARVIPSDAVQARVLAELQHGAGCTKTYVLDDGEVDGRDVADSFQVAAKNAGVNIVGTQEFEPHAASYTSLASGVAQTGANCIVLAALTQNNAVLITRELAAALPNALIFGTDGLAESSYADPAQGGIPLALDPRVLITSATLSPSDYPPSARRFYAAYERRYGTPELSAIYGYEAMSLMLDAIMRATQDGSSHVLRSKVLSAIFATRNRRSVLGTYSIDGNGDTSLDRYGVYRIVDGQLRFVKAMQG